MNLRKLELFGFKSFMRKLDIHFSDGITVIVGPNGCGKTNVTDAVRWVLGESNARTLRGAKMEDLIFNGTADYKPLNVAEVELTVDNSSGILPIDYSEVTVTRRIYREGEPEFLINKVPARMRDVHELFMDTGLGSRAYSVIEREMVEMVLADQPEKRRELIEEAAGIHKYKIRERQARRKLESTDADLHRISDVLREVERQVRSLKRQVGAAQRFQEIRDRQRELEVALAWVDLEDMDGRTASLREALAENETERLGAGGRVAAVEAELETLRVRMAEAEHRLADEQREVDRLADDARAAESEVLVRRERRDALAESARRLAREREELGERLTEGAQRGERLVAAHAESTAFLEGVEERLHVEEESLGRLDSDLASRRAGLARARELVEAASQDVGRLRTELANVEARAAHLADRRSALEAETRELAARLAGRERELAEAAERIRGLRAGLELRERELESAGAERDALDSRRDSAREEDARLAVEVESARSGLEMLSALQSAYEGYGQGARALLLRGGPYSPLADLVKPARDDLLPALEAALEGAVEFVVARDSSAVSDAVSWLRSGEGRATILDATGFRGDGAKTVPAAVTADSAVLGPVRAFLHAEGELGAVLDHLTAGMFVVESLEDAVRLARRAESRGLRFVARNGDWAEHPGIVRGGTPAASGESRLLGRAARVAELGARVAEAEERRQAARRRAQAFSVERESLGARMEELRNAASAARETLLAEERIAERLRAEMAAAEGRRDAVRLELGEVATSLEDLAREKRARLAALDEGEVGRLRLEEEWKRREAEIVDSSAMREQAQAACHELRLEAQRLRGELDKIGLDRERLEESRQALEQGLARRAEEAAANERTGIELGREIELGEAEVARRVQVLAERKAVRDRAADERGGILEQLRTVDEERGRWSRLRDQSQELSHRNEMELSRLESARHELVGRVEREFGARLSLPDAREAHGTLSGADPEVLEAARRELEELRRTVDRMGAVNLVALEQYEREEKRYEFLKTQRDDLEEAREKLHRTIRKINRTARTLFMDTLTAVQGNFQRTFGTLFEGGHADIRLVGDEDPLHAPIEVFARPRGKRLNSISLMSSGERALTAVAFLFAIYLVKPSPFCILDEVDAPLDDANIGRFLAMLREVSKKTQFVMITHNKKTMEVADYLYGVTMQEPGVSQLVSVRLGRERGDGRLEETSEADEAAEEGDAAEEELVAEGSA
jgi:chromosome segregation protein